MINKEKIVGFVKKYKIQIVAGGVTALLLCGTIVAIGYNSKSSTSKKEEAEIATETSNLSSSEIETDVAGEIKSVKVGETEYELKEYESEEKDGAIIYKLGDEKTLTVKGDKAFVSKEVENTKKVAEQTTKVAETTEETQETTVEQTTVAQTTVATTAATIAQTTAKPVVTQPATTKAVEATTAQVVAPVVTPPVNNDATSPAALSGFNQQEIDHRKAFTDTDVSAITRHFTGFPKDTAYTYYYGRGQSFPTTPEPWSYGELYKPLQMQYTNGNGHWFNMWCFYYRAATDHTGTASLVPNLDDRFTIFEQMQDTIAQSLGYTDRYNLYQNGGGTRTVYLGNFEGIGPVGVCFMLKW